MDYQSKAGELTRALLDFFSEREKVFLEFINEVWGRLSSGKKILIFGNGGSASQAQHFAAELVNKYLRERPPLKAIALTTDSSILTSTANDSSFERVFSRQVEALGEPGDVALGLSTSGRSPNVVLALRVAREKGLLTAAFTGKEGSACASHADYVFEIPSSSTPRIQEIHLFLLHLLAEELEARVS